MLTFFRRIRKGLLDGGRTRRYLVYAIGEILLVMIGILLALQVNNWNENRKLKIEETKLLRSIKEQFSFNLTELNSAIETARMTQDRCIHLLNNMGSKGVKLSRNESDSLIWSGLQRIVTYDASNGILDDILHSGRLHIISNDMLRKKLANWLSVLGDAKEDEKWAVEARNDHILPFLRQHYPARSSYQTLDNTVITSGFDLNYRQVFSIQEFENIVDQHRDMNGRNERNYNGLKEYIEEVLSLCSRELQERN
jgi:hypothetical protein